LNTWTHFATTYNGLGATNAGVAIAYVNGQAFPSSSEWSGTLSPGTDCTTWTCTLYTHGQWGVANVKVAGTVLSASQITGDYNLGAPSG
jgi:hypothetical protein